MDVKDHVRLDRLFLCIMHISMIPGAGPFLVHDIVEEVQSMEVSDEKISKLNVWHGRCSGTEISDNKISMMTLKRVFEATHRVRKT